MKRLVNLSLVMCVLLTWTVGEVLARGGGGGGGRGGGGGGGARPSGGGGASRPSPSVSRSPAVSRPSPSVNRPSTPAARPSTGATRPAGGAVRPSTGAGTRPSTGAGTRPSTGAGTRPSTGARPSSGDLNNFLDMPKASTGAIGGAGNRAGSGVGAAVAGGVAGGAAAEFLKGGDAAGRAGAADRADVAGNRTERAEGRTEGRTERTEGRTEGRTERTEGRTDRRDDREASRPDRIEDRQQRQQDRVGRRDEIRDQVRDNYPLMNFWSDNPGWAAWRIATPYRWATWGAITGWVGYGWNDSVPYSYGENVYYQDDQVYYGDQTVASAEEYAQQAEEIAIREPEVAADKADWMPLGVFALTPDGEKSGPAPTLFMQLAVSKEGIIAGTLNDAAADSTKTIEGAVDKKTQRAAWTVQGKARPVLETGIVNLTQDAAPALLHFEDGTTQQWLLVRLEEPAEKK